MGASGNPRSSARREDSSEVCNLIHSKEFECYDIDQTNPELYTCGRIKPICFFNNSFGAITRL